jgi:hypothetical protein
MKTNTETTVVLKIILFIIYFLAIQFQGISQNIQMTPRPKINALKVAKGIIIDGQIEETAWKEASVLNNLIEFRPTPFKAEHPDSKSEIYIMYNNDGIYVGGHCYESTKDSVTSELIGRDGFGNNDFFCLILDTYNDKN